MIGQKLLHYEIVEKLGEGGMGVVYKARDSHLDRFVAIKVLPPEKVADAGRKARFVQEAKAASALNHPNIVHVYDISSDGGVDFIAMEYVAGKTLDQLIPRKGMRLNDALKIAVQTADALTRAHAAGIVHRDLKPSNLMVDEHGLVKVLDFGLAKLTETALGEDEATRTVKPRTEEGTIVGTAAYMSPEQAEGKTVDARSDIFSFGAVLYEMVTGARAFRGDSRMSTLAAVLHHEPAPMGAEIPRELERIIRRCLRKDPARRFQHVDDVKIALEELKEESDSGTLGEPAPGPRPRRSRRRLWWMAGACGLLLCACVLVVVWRQRAETLASPKMIAVTAMAGNTRDGAISPDGKHVAFAVLPENTVASEIHVQTIGEGDARRLTGNQGLNISPTWSPDGASIAYVRLFPESYEVWTVSTVSGKERKLGTFRRLPWSSAPLSEPFQRSGIVRSHDRLECGISWAPDGRGIVVAERDGDRPARVLYRFDIATSAKRRLTSTASPVREALGVISPDSRRVAFVRQATFSPAGELFVQDLSSGGAPVGEPRQITRDSVTIAGLTWTPTGREIVFSSSRMGTHTLWQVPPEGGEPRAIGAPGRYAMYPSAARNAPRLAFGDSDLDWNIWRIPGPSAGIRDRQAKPVAQSALLDFGPAFSPDGHRLLFTSTRSGASRIWIADADGSGASEFRTDGGESRLGSVYAGPWSPDGKQLAFTMRHGTQSLHAFVASSEGGPARRLTRHDDVETVWGWSADGGWVYVGVWGTGEQKLFKAPAAGIGPPVPVIQRGVTAARESADGRYLYYEDAAGHVIWRMPGSKGASGESEQRVLALRPAEGWALADAGICLIDPGTPGGPTIRFFDFRRGTAAILFQAPKPFPRPFGGSSSQGLAITRDGQWIAYESEDRAEGGLMVMENFR